MRTVLWGAMRDDIQFGSQEDLEQAEAKRRLARAIRGLSRAMRETQIHMHQLGMSAREATKSLAKAARVGQDIQKRKAS